jgi:hypothetical protein
MDLVGRKLGLADGQVVESFFDRIARDLDHATPSQAALIAGATRDALALLRTATASLKGVDLDTAGAVAVDYQRLFALVSLGWMWTLMAAAAADATVPLHNAKRAVADFYADRVLPQAKGLAASIASGGRATMALAAEAF